MHAMLVARPFHHGGWAYEEKVDGYRMVEHFFSRHEAWTQASEVERAYILAGCGSEAPGPLVGPLGSR